MRKHTSLVKKETIDNALKAIKLRRQGDSVAIIVNKLKLSKSRIYELLKMHNWNSGS